MDPITKRGIIAFLIPTAIGAGSYALATLTAWGLAKEQPRLRYFARLVLLVMCYLLGALLFLPAYAWTGSSDHYVTSGAGGLGIAQSYGMYTLWIWFALALGKHPWRHRQAKDEAPGLASTSIPGEGAPHYPTRGAGN